VLGVAHAVARMLVFTNQQESASAQSATAKLHKRACVLAQCEKSQISTTLISTRLKGSEY